jgi:hypothetical protein
MIARLWHERAFRLRRNDIALAYDAESRSQRARALPVHNHSLMQFCLLHVQQRRLTHAMQRAGESGTCACERALAAEPVQRKASIQSVESMRMLAALNSAVPFRDWRGNRMKNDRLAVPHRKIYPTVHPDWRLTTNDNVAAVKAIPPLTSKGDQHGEDGQVYSPYRTVW